jgi:hypothetical protein
MDEQSFHLAPLFLPRFIDFDVRIFWGVCDVEQIAQSLCGQSTSGSREIGNQCTT